MVRNGFDRKDLVTMPCVEFARYWEELRKQLEAEAEVTKKARPKK